MLCPCYYLACAECATTYVNHVAALVLVDMQSDFMSLAGRNGDNIQNKDDLWKLMTLEKRMVRLLSAARKAGRDTGAQITYFSRVPF